MKMQKKKQYVRKFKFDQYAFSILVAIELLMSFTFLGYIHIPPISITIAYIPIVVAGCLFGTAESAFTGFIFGMGSLYKASAYYVMTADKVFSPFQSEAPVGSLILSVGTRVLFGVLVGVAFAAVKHNKHKIVWNGIVAVMAPKVHTILVYGFMGIFFPELGFDYRTGLHYIKGEWVLALACGVSVEIIYMIYNSESVRKVADAVNEAESSPYSSKRVNQIVTVIGVFTLCMACFSTIYFAQRAEYMLEKHGIKVSETIYKDLLHLQVQFLIAMLALDFILLLLMLLVYKFMSYKEYMGEMDPLTGIMGRRLFLHYCTKAQSEKYGPKMGWFLFLDVDHFKQINDTLGHTAGDDVLKMVAEDLQKIIDDKGAVGRVGGDEFAVLIDKELSKEELERILREFLDDISGICKERTVSCSIGAYHFTFPQIIRELLTETDQVLYEAKERGRARFVIKEEKANV